MYTKKSNFNKEKYAERVSRTVPFLGFTEEEQQESQDIISKATVGIAGAGGIGGAMAVRLARFGVKKIKIADPQDFDLSNINRQLGASIDTVGNNKAETVAKIAHEIGLDVEIEVYKDGITTNNAQQFVEGCDILLDQLDFSLIKEKYALHRAFRTVDRCKYILACSVIGWSAHLYKFTKRSLKLEDWYGFENTDNLLHLAEDSRTEKLLKLWASRFPHFPTCETVMSSIKKTGFLPIFAGAPPLAEGFLTQRVILCLLDKEFPPYAVSLPPIPYMYIYDAATLSGGVYLSDGELHEENQVKFNFKEGR